MRFEIVMLAEDRKDGLAGIGEHAACDLVEQPNRQVGRQIGFEAQAAFGRRLAQVARLCGALLPLVFVVDLVLCRGLRAAA